MKSSISVTFALIIAVLSAASNTKECKNDVTFHAAWRDSTSMSDSIQIKLKREYGNLPSLCLVTKNCDSSLRASIKSTKNTNNNKELIKLRLFVNKNGKIDSISNGDQSVSNAFASEIAKKIKSDIQIKEEFSFGTIGIAIYPASEGVDFVVVNDWVSMSDTTKRRDLMNSSDSMNNLGRRNPKELIADIESQKKKMQTIYEEYLSSGNKFEGKLNFKFTIDKFGKIIALSIKDSTTTCSEFKREIFELFKEIRFKEIPFGNVTATFRIVLHTD